MAQSQRLREVLQNCSEGDVLECTHLDSRNDTYLTENMKYKVTVDDDGDLCILDDDGDTLDDVSSLFVKVPSGTSPSTQGNTVIEGVLEDVLKHCSEGDTLECTYVFSKKHFTINKTYQVIMGVKNKRGELCIVNEKGMECTGSTSDFKLVQKASIQYSPSAPYSAAKPASPTVVPGKPVQSAQLAPWEEATKSNDEKEKPRSIVDGDYSQYCTWDVEDPETKTSEWKPDTIREDVDIMESIRHACNRT